MQRLSVLYPKGSINFANVRDGQLDYGVVSILPRVLHGVAHGRFWLIRSKDSSIMNNASLDTLKMSRSFREIKSVSDENQGELSDEEEGLCPVDCVKEFMTDQEFLKIFEKAKETGALVVVDFYRTSCGSCRYIEQGFMKLCKGSGGQDAEVIFLKHNVLDEYDEQSEVAERLRIKTVPLFHFYKDGALLEAFPTRDKERILTAIRKYTSNSSEDI